MIAWETFFCFETWDDSTEGSSKHVAVDAFGRYG